MAKRQGTRAKGRPSLHSVFVHTLVSLDLGGSEEADKIITNLWANGVKLTWLRKQSRSKK